MITAPIDSEYGRPFTTLSCPSCGGRKAYVIDSRNLKIGARRRRHECQECKYHYTTYEIYAEKYEKMQAAKVDKLQFESVIATLQIIKEQFGDSNGHRD